MKNNLLTLLSFLLVCFLVGCQQNADELPSSIITPEIAQNSDKDAFLSKINDLVNSIDVQNQIAEPLGDVHFEDLHYFNSEFEENVTFVPLYTKASDHTEAIIIGTERGGRYKLGILTRGTLWKYADRPSGKVASISILASIFKAADQNIFSNYTTDLREIIGEKENAKGAAVRSQVITSTDLNIKSEWDYDQHCFGWGDEGEGELYCWYTVTWEESPSDPIMIDQGSSGGGGGTYVPFRFDDKIDDSGLPDCFKGVVADIKKLEGGINEAIKSFTGKFAQFNWKLNTGTNIGGTNASTSRKYDFNSKTATTTLDISKFKASSRLSIARTLLHEALHAYMLSVMKTDVQKFENDFPALMEAYSNSTYSTVEEAQHASFVNDWVDGIAASLQELGRSMGLVNDYQFYSDLAWGGLTSTYKRGPNGQRTYNIYNDPINQEAAWFKEAFPKKSDRRRVENTNLIEQTGKDRGFHDTPQKGGDGC